MSNKVKIPCGGFYIGDGLTMDGNTLKSSGNSLIVTKADYTHVSHTSTEIYEAFQSGKTVYLDAGELILQLSGSSADIAIFNGLLTMDGEVLNFSATVNNTAEINISQYKIYPANG